MFETVFDVKIVSVLCQIVNLHFLNGYSFLENKAGNPGSLHFLNMEICSLFSAAIVHSPNGMI